MRIAQIAPLAESVPPQLYGGTERVVSALTEELVSRGHDVTLFASADSITSARLEPCAEQSLRLAGKGRDYVAYTMMQLGSVFDRADEFDVIHNHVDYLAFPFAMQSPSPVVTTAHGRLDLEEVQHVYYHYRRTPLVSISDAQRRPLPHSTWVATVYNGIDFERYKLRTRPGQYLAYLGRMSPEKRPDRAIEVARIMDMPLKMAAKVDENDREYFDHAVRPHLRHSMVEFVGEVDETGKDQFLGEAFAYLFPIDWPEPFGLTMVESMACGTPVVAMAHGSVPEVVEHGVSGLVCRSMRDFIDAVPLAGSLDRAACRAAAAERFSARAMADGYEAAYRRLMRSNDASALSIHKKARLVQPPRPESPAPTAVA